MNSHHDSGAASPGPPPVPHSCPKCRRPIGGGDAFCRFCGARQRSAEPFYYHPVWILLLAFLVLGPFALGLVWRSRTMSGPMKMLLGVIIGLYSAVTFYAAYVILAAMYKHFSLLNEVL